MEIYNYEKCLQAATKNFRRDWDKIESVSDLFNSSRTLLTDNFQACFEALHSSLKQAQSFTILSAVEEMIEIILICLNSRRFTTVEVLSRVVLEHSVNLLYIIAGKGKERAFSFLRAHFDNAYARARKWHEFALKSGRPNIIEAAAGRMAYLDASRARIPEIANAQAWPDARRRFQVLEIEEAYHDIFAPASDAIHALAEDTYNNWFTERNTEPEHEGRVMQLNLAEKGSYAVYMGANAVALYAQLVERLLAAALCRDAESEIEKIIRRLNEILISFTLLRNATDEAAG
ncbi:DUF5677 domain-containing protein [Burkholderia lata]|uniref:Uncharacterized protein n=1 Tax=Burkholderia lata (strain ATCC 17760 / DSM 23089 / LMG 22485 / NCIMB 9086 / R18194 / 383) TaxID=482957 RepID=A0A6P2IR41_BURL3|nr:DUF5677 domain-containing protein [Burkholderia lata]VWB32287.1 hypothetical protein BLA15945_01421 [Burkholderia lata]